MNRTTTTSRSGLLARSGGLRLAGVLVLAGLLASAGLLAFAGVLGASIARVPLAHAAPAETETRAAHPLYDDAGALDWRTQWADAARIASERRSLIFVEWGRES